MRSLDGNVKMNFNEWFEEHKDELAQLLRGDQEEALYRAWLAGMEYGCFDMDKVARGLWKLK
jgi:hypothetical protein